MRSSARATRSSARPALLPRSGARLGTPSRLLEPHLEGEAEALVGHGRALDAEDHRGARADGDPLRVLEAVALADVEAPALVAVGPHGVVHVEEDLGGASGVVGPDLVLLVGVRPRVGGQADEEGSSERRKACRPRDSYRFASSWNAPRLPDAVARGVPRGQDRRTPLNSLGSLGRTTVGSAEVKRNRTSTVGKAESRVAGRLRGAQAAAGRGRRLPASRRDRASTKMAP